MTIAELSVTRSGHSVLSRGRAFIFNADQSGSKRIKAKIEQASIRVYPLLSASNGFCFPICDADQSGLKRIKAKIEQAPIRVYPRLSASKGFCFPSGQPV
jgi:hypothetical protein